jgi:hypothetical protein
VPRIVLTTTTAAPAQRCFDLSLDLLAERNRWLAREVEAS